MTTLALLLVFPLAWPFVAKLIWKHEITLPELGLNILIGALVVTAGWAMGRYLETYDVEILNGQVTGKYSKRVSCEHSYSCNCTQVCSGSGDKRTCSQVCQRCFHHDYDVDWVLNTTLGSIKISRVNSRGTTEPPRYTRAQAGDPVAQTNSFTNYVKAAPDSLFNTLAQKQALQQFAQKLPSYPDDIYDYHYVNRVLTDEVPLPDASGWNMELARLLRDLGPSKQVNVVIVFTKEADPRYADALNASWLGGKKNDVVVVLGTPAYPDIGWARVLSWTDREVFKVQLRDALQDLKTVDRASVLSTIDQHIRSGFTRRSMEDFSYLENEIEPPGWAIGLLVFLSVLASVGASVYLSKNMHTTRGVGRYRYR